MVFEGHAVWHFLESAYEVPQYETDSPGHHKAISTARTQSLENNANDFIARYARWEGATGPFEVLRFAVFTVPKDVHHKEIERCLVIDGQIWIEAYVDPPGYT